MNAIDTFNQHAGLASDPGDSSFAITPSDSAQLPFVTRALYIGTAGNVAVQLINDSSPVTLMNCVAGSVLPFRVKQVMNTNTTASNLVGIY